VLEALTGEVELAARRALAQGASETVVLTASTGLAVTVLLEVFSRQPTLLLVGGVHVAQALMSLARPLGYRTVVADGRAGWLTRERFPDADLLLCAWPEEAFAEVGIDSSTCICLLSHDPKFDEPAMRLALRSPAAYVGAIGSRKTQASRRARLLEEGFTPDELARLHGPIGLDLGGREPMDTALAIMAEIAAARHGASGGFLSRRPTA
jgi:xanthine dehydrogenase accessory factor